MASAATKAHRREHGLCVECGERAAKDRTRCPKHVATMRATEAARRERRRKGGRCVTCGGRAVRDRRYCQTHLDYYRARNRKSRD